MQTKHNEPWLQFTVLNRERRSDSSVNTNWTHFSEMNLMYSTGVENLHDVITRTFHVLMLNFDLKKKKMSNPIFTLLLASDLCVTPEWTHAHIQPKKRSTPTSTRKTSFVRQSNENRTLIWCCCSVASNTPGHAHNQWCHHSCQRENTAVTSPINLNLMRKISNHSYFIFTLWP